MILQTEKFYGNAAMYAFMPQSVFDKAETAYNNGYATFEVTDAEYNQINTAWQEVR